MNVSDDAALWQIGSAWVNFVLRGVIVFFFVFLLLRLSGKRQIGQMTPFDLVLLLLIRAISTAGRPLKVIERRPSRHQRAGAACDGGYRRADSCARHQAPGSMGTPS